MAKPNKPTKAHLTRKWLKSLPPAAKELEKRKMKYYMGAKLMEVGVEPKSATLRWDVSTQGRMEVWTCRAYWGESQEQLLREES